MANIVGKRYTCQVCGSEFIVTKGGDGCLQCHGRPMQVKDSQAATSARKQEAGS